MNHFINLLLEDRKLIYAVLSFFFLFLFFLSYLIQYSYLSYNLKGICKIIFNDEKYFRLPLEPFNSYFLSCLPLVFWRETLNIKKGVQFKKLYGKEFYYPMNKTQLKKILNQYPKLFYIQYLIFLFGILFFIFMLIGCILIKYF